MSYLKSITCKKCGHKNYFIRLTECPACDEKYETKAD